MCVREEHLVQHLNVAARVVGGGGGVSSINKKVEVKEELVASPQAVESERICSSVHEGRESFSYLCWKSFV